MIVSVLGMWRLYAKVNVGVVDVGVITSLDSVR